MKWMDLPESMRIWVVKLEDISWNVLAKRSKLRIDDSIDDTVFESRTNERVVSSSCGTRRFIYNRIIR